MNLLKKFFRGEEGMEALQVIMILAAAAVVVTGLAWVWGGVKEKFKTAIESFIQNFGGTVTGGGGAD